MRRTPVEPRSDIREGWQIVQGRICACHGADDMCVCQNVDEPWKYGRGGERPPTTEERLRGALEAVRDWDALHDSFPDGLARQVREALSDRDVKAERALWQENEDLRRELYRANETIRQARLGNVSPSSIAAWRAAPGESVTGDVRPPSLTPDNTRSASE